MALILSISLGVTSYAEIKTFIKEGESVVQKDQSVNQVIDYLKQKLARQAQEQAGKFITSELKIENKTITKDEFKSFAGSIAKTTVLEETPFMKGKEQYVKVKIKADIDTDTVKTYLEKMMQDKKYEEQAKKAIKEAENLRKEKLQLEEKLKTATKKQYEQELSAQVQQQVELQKQRAIELNKMALKAKEEYAKAEQEQKQKELKRQKELNVLKTQIEQENLKTQQKIAQEKDNIKKAELENQAKIKELKYKAKENMINWQQTTAGTTIEQAIEEATKVKQELNELFDKFETLSKTNKQDLIKSYDMQINILKATEFKEQKPVKSTWETQDEYNEKLQQYENNKQQFKEKNNQKIKELKTEKEDKLLKEEIEILKSTINTTKPSVYKLESFQTEQFYSKDGIKAKLISIEPNVEEQYLILNVDYEKKKYSVKYDFSGIGRQKAKLMCDTQDQFVIEPLFSVNNNLKKEVVAFNIKHLGLGTDLISDISSKINIFKEIDKFNFYNKTLIKKIDNFNFYNKIKQNEITCTDENFNVIKNCITEIVELEELFNTAFLLSDGKNIMLKNGKKIVLYNIKNDKVTAFRKAYISYDMLYVLEDITEATAKIFSVGYNTYVFFSYPSSSRHEFFFSSDNVICFQGYNSWYGRYENSAFYKKCDNYFHASGGLEFKSIVYKNDYKKYEEEYKKYEKFISDLESVSYNDSFTTKNNEKLQIFVNESGIDIKNLSANKIYKSLKTNNKITSANFTKDGNIIVLLNRTKVLMWDISK